MAKIRFDYSRLNGHRSFYFSNYPDQNVEVTVGNLSDLQATFSNSRDKSEFELSIRQLNSAQQSGADVFLTIRTRGATDQTTMATVWLTPGEVTFLASASADQALPYPITLGVGWGFPAKNPVQDPPNAASFVSTSVSPASDGADEERWSRMHISLEKLRDRMDFGELEYALIGFRAAGARTPHIFRRRYGVDERHTRFTLPISKTAGDPASLDDADAYFRAKNTDLYLVLAARTRSDHANALLGRGPPDTAPGWLVATRRPEHVASDQLFLRLDVNDTIYWRNVPSRGGSLSKNVQVQDNAATARGVLKAFAQNDNLQPSVERMGGIRVELCPRGEPQDGASLGDKSLANMIRQVFVLPDDPNCEIIVSVYHSVKYKLRLAIDLGAGSQLVGFRDPGMGTGWEAVPTSTDNTNGYSFKQEDAPDLVASQDGLPLYAAATVAEELEYYHRWQTNSVRALSHVPVIGTNFEEMRRLMAGQDVTQFAKRQLAAGVGGVATGSEHQQDDFEALFLGMVQNRIRFALHKKLASYLVNGEWPGHIAPPQLIITYPGHFEWNRFQQLQTNLLSIYAQALAPFSRTVDYIESVILVPEPVALAAGLLDAGDAEFSAAPFSCVLDMGAATLDVAFIERTDDDYTGLRAGAECGQNVRHVSSAALGGRELDFAIMKAVAGLLIGNETANPIAQDLTDAFDLTDEAIARGRSVGDDTGRALVQARRNARLVICATKRALSGKMLAGTADPCLELPLVPQLGALSPVYDQRWLPEQLFDAVEARAAALSPQGVEIVDITPKPGNNTWRGLRVPWSLLAAQPALTRYRGAFKAFIEDTYNRGHLLRTGVNTPCLWVLGGRAFRFQPCRDWTEEAMSEQKHETGKSDSLDPISSTLGVAARAGPSTEDDHKWILVGGALSIAEDTALLNTVPSGDLTLLFTDSKNRVIAAMAVEDSGAEFRLTNGVTGVTVARIGQRCCEFVVASETSGEDQALREMFNLEIPLRSRTHDGLLKDVPAGTSAIVVQTATSTSQNMPHLDVRIEFNGPSGARLGETDWQVSLLGLPDSGRSETLGQ